SDKRSDLSFRARVEVSPLSRTLPRERETMNPTASIRPMPAISTAPLAIAELEQTLQAVDASALLVPPRILRRVIKQHSHPAALGLQVPHRKAYAIDRAALLEIATRDELGVAADRDLPATLILLARPDPQRLARQHADQVLLKFWRLLFHVRVHRALEQQSV